ncbi:MAG: preprotein translocase subunit SecD [Candidatus Peregrinibacteria bacterium Gr01-1014_25]|nr:MAG: preprotein translocase subunit SecD [Candidatus Peregrinibacteria bacterium Gr01-1014_25]
MQRRSPIVTKAALAIASVLIVLFAIPQSWRGFLPGILGSANFRFGLDLAGGTQLDFRISEDEIAQQLAQLDAEEAALGSATGDRRNEIAFQRQVLRDQQSNIVEAIRTVLERRINALGVSEATITPSYVGNEKHLLVECPGVIDVQKCIETVGKTIQLEFKEEHTEATAAFETSVRAKADQAMSRIRAGETLQAVGQDMGDELGMSYTEERQYFREQLPKGLEELFQRSPAAGILRREVTVTVAQPQEDGTTEQREIKGVALAELTQPRSTAERGLNRADEAFPLLAQQEKDLSYRQSKEERLTSASPARLAAALKSMKPGELRAVGMEDGSAHVLFLRLFTPGREEMAASHILVSYRGAAQADPSVTRTKEEALARAQELKRQLDAGASFPRLATAASDGPSGKTGGSLGTFGRGTMVPEFERIAFALPKGAISAPVETPFGYHLIRADSSPTTSPDVVSYDDLRIPAGPDAEMRGNGIIGKLQSGLVKKQEPVVTARLLFFSLVPSGWQDTQLDGKHFRSAAVTTDPTTNFPVVQILFDSEGGRLFQELTKRNIEKRIAIFVGGELVSAPVVREEIAGGSAVISGSTSFDEARQLATDLNTGAIPAPIHLVGQRTVEPTLGADALRTSALAGFFGILVVMLYMLVMYRVFGILANISLAVYALLFLTILKLPLFLVTGQYIVLTLAGAAGLILSIGMAVDTNVLIFERIREELRRGKPLKTSIETGFTRSWPSIRDSNVATIITCSLLFIIGTSIVRGFAVTLGMGVVISMFTGITVTRWICRWVASSAYAHLLLPRVSTVSQQA